jgi:hypothetical protein
MVKGGEVSDPELHGFIIVNIPCLVKQGNCGLKLISNFVDTDRFNEKA